MNNGKAMIVGASAGGPVVALCCGADLISKTRLSRFGPDENYWRTVSHPSIGAAQDCFESRDRIVGSYELD